VQAVADSYAFWILMFMVLAAAYLLPTLVGLIRGVNGLGLVFLVNLIGAPTGVGWIAALILAFGPRRIRAVSAGARTWGGSQAGQRT
jgi:Superinfection immunity protein